MRNKSLKLSFNCFFVGTLYFFIYFFPFITVNFISSIQWTESVVQQLCTLKFDDFAFTTFTVASSTTTLIKVLTCYFSAITVYPPYIKNNLLLCIMQPIINGSLAGSLAVLITNPFDLAKTRLQLQGELQAYGTYEKHYRGVIDALRRTIREEGKYSVYKGLQSAIVFQIIMNGLRFGMYEITKTNVSNTHFYKRYIFPSNIAISAIVGYFSALISSPFNMIKTRLMLQSNFIPGGNRYHYNGLIDALRTIHKLEGIPGLYKGSTIMACRTSLGSGVQLPAYDLSKKFYDNHFNNYWAQTILASATSTFFLCTITCPLEGIMTRYFNQPFIDGKGQTYAGAIEAFFKILKTEGLLGLYKGLGGLFWRSGPQSFLSLIIVNKLNSKR